MKLIVLKKFCTIFKYSKNIPLVNKILNEKNNVLEFNLFLVVWYKLIMIFCSMWEKSKKCNKKF